MSASERDFATFELGDNVYELASGVIPDIAERLDVRLSHEPNSAEMQTILDRYRINKVLRHNEEITAIDRPARVELVTRSGIQEGARRSLWSPKFAAVRGVLDAIIIMDGMANWMDRSAEDVPEDLKGVPIYTVGGTRVSNTGTEVVNPNVKALAPQLEGYPTGAQYMGKIIVPKLETAGHTVRKQPLDAYKSQDGDTMLREFFTLHPELLDGAVAIQRVANASGIMCVQMRDAARAIDPSFDTSPDSPQAYYINKPFPVAETDEQEKDGRHYQKSTPAMSQLVLKAKKLHLASGGE